MSDCRPDRRWGRVEEALRTKTPPASDSLCRIYTFCVDPPEKILEELSYEEEVIQQTIDIIRIAEDRHTLMIFFLCGATNEEISKSLYIPIDVVILVQQLIFDREEFRNKLEQRRYTREYAEQLSKDNKKLLEASVALGPGYLVAFFRQGHEVIDVDEKRYGKLLLEQAAHKGLVARGNAITSKASQFSKGWSKDAVGMLMNSEKLGFETGVSDRAQALLDEDDTTQTAEEAGLTIDDIHH
jgi:hypothetical protein